MRAAWWWIDRWRKSTAYTDMSLAEQGAYRNLLDELWLRDGALPMSDRILAKICGDPFMWNEVKPVVLARFVVVDGVYRNETHDTIMARSQYQADKQKRYRDKHGNSKGNTQGNVTSNVTGSPSPSPSPSKDQDPNSENDNGHVRSAKPKRTTYPDDFEAFWSAYPSKVGKKVALKAWKAARKDGMPDLDTVVAAVERQSGRRRWSEGIIPNPSTWLNQGRWDDGDQVKPMTKAQRIQADTFDAIRQAREDDDAYEASLRRESGGACGSEG